MPSLDENGEAEEDEEDDAKAGAMQAPRTGNPKQASKTGKGDEGGGESEMLKKDGLKLRIELNLDIELELKAKICGDITLALL